eukprot:2256679-Rhodomonas_salina.3
MSYGILGLGKYLPHLLVLLLVSLPTPSPRSTNVVLARPACQWAAAGTETALSYAMPRPSQAAHTSRSYNEAPQQLEGAGAEGGVIRGVRCWGEDGPGRRSRVRAYTAAHQDGRRGEEGRRGRRKKEGEGGRQRKEGGSLRLGGGGKGEGGVLGESDQRGGRREDRGSVTGEATCRCKRAPGTR